MATAVTSTEPRSAATTTLWSRLTRGRAVVHREPDWEEFAGPSWLERIMTVAVPDRHHAKQGRSIGRWTLTHDGRTLVVYLKRHFVLPRRHGLLAVFCPGRPVSPGLEEWEHLAWAKANGIPVPRAVAVGEFLGPWGRLQSFLAVEELEGMLPLHEAIPLAYRELDTVVFARWKRGLIAELARLTRELHRRKTFHQDLYFCHFYVARDDIRTPPAVWRGRVTMIDFHRLAHRRVASAWWQAKDLGQLLYSTYDVPGVTDRDRVRFWKLYRSGEWDAGIPPRWLRAVARVRAGRSARRSVERAARAGG
jgi:heptose I phosphotransferase